MLARFLSFLPRSMDSPCECEHNNPDSLDARLFPSVVLPVAPAVTMDEAFSLSRCGCSAYAHTPEAQSCVLSYLC